MEMTDEMLAEKIKRCVYLHMSHRSTKCVSWRHARKRRDYCDDGRWRQ